MQEEHKSFSAIDLDGFNEARKEFLAHLRYTRGYSEKTCYGYSSDMNVWIRWLAQAGIDWRQVKPVEVEYFVNFMSRNGLNPNTIARKVACLATFYKWSKRNGRVSEDPIYLIEKPKRPRRIPVWLEKEEQAQLQKVMRTHDDIPDNIFGRSRASRIDVRERYDRMFDLIQKTGLRISEALRLKVSDIRCVDGIAISVRVIGKGNKERIVPIPDSIGRILAMSLSRLPASEFVFAKSPGGQPMTPHAVRAYLKKMVVVAGLDKAVTPHKLRHTYATRLLEANAQLVDIQALLGHESIATTQIYTHAGQERLSKLVAGI